MNAEELNRLLTEATPAELRNILCCTWVLDAALVGRAAELACCAAGHCTCGATVDHDGNVTPAAVA